MKSVTIIAIAVVFLFVPLNVYGIHVNAEDYHVELSDTLGVTDPNRLLTKDTANSVLQELIIKQDETLSVLKDSLENQDEALSILNARLIISEQKNAQYSALSIIFAAIGLLAGIALFYQGQRSGKKQHEQSKQHIEEVIDNTADKIVQKVVDVANAQLRVKDGGKVALRKEGNVAADVTREMQENVGKTTDNVSATVTRAKDAKPVAQNEVKHSTDTIVARNKKTFTMDAILVTEEEQEDKNPKKEPKETSED